MRARARFRALARLARIIFKVAACRMYGNAQRKIPAANRILRAEIRAALTGASLSPHQL
jgi:hypothetical protein